MPRRKPLEEGAWYVVDLATLQPIGHAFKTEAGARAHAEHLNDQRHSKWGRGREFGVARAKRVGT